MLIWTLCGRLATVQNDAMTPTDAERKLLQEALFAWIGCSENQLLSQLTLHFLLLALIIPSSAALHVGEPGAVQFLRGFITAVVQSAALTPDQMTAAEVQLSLILSSATLLACQARFGQGLVCLRQLGAPQWLRLVKSPAWHQHRLLLSYEPLNAPIPKGVPV